MADLQVALSGWKPAPAETSETIRAWPTAAFSALLDLPGPVATERDPLPPLWHWFHFLDAPRQSELGDDGHPADGRFMPPIPDRRRMMAGGRMHVHSPILIGDRVQRRTELAEVSVKHGRSGQMAFVTVRHEFRRGTDLLLTEEQDIVYRSQPVGQQRALPSGTADEPRHDWRTSTPTTPELLFRFSALTYNTHRIHYDQPYTTSVEGYPSLVVHGPLLALLLLEIPRRHCRHPVTSFQYRLSSPAFAGATIVTHGRRTDGDTIDLSGRAQGRRTSITGTATLA